MRFRASRHQDWSDLIDNNGEDPSCQFLFTADSLKKFIRLHCKDGWAATRDIPAFVQSVEVVNKQTSSSWPEYEAEEFLKPTGSNYQSSNNIIFRPPPRSLLFPLLDISGELIREIAKKCETDHWDDFILPATILTTRAPLTTAINPEIHNLSYTSKNIRDLVLWFVFHRFNLRRKIDVLADLESFLSELEGEDDGIERHDLDRSGLPGSLDLHKIDEIRYFETIPIFPDDCCVNFADPHSISKWFEIVFKYLEKTKQPLRRLHLGFCLEGSVGGNISFNEQKDKTWIQRFSRSIEQFQHLESFTYSSSTRYLSESWHTSLIIPRLLQSLPSSLKCLEVPNSGLTTKESWQELQRFDSLKVLKLPGFGNGMAALEVTPTIWNTHLEKLIITSPPTSSRDNSNLFSVPTLMDLFRAAASTIRFIQIKGGEWPSPGPGSFAYDRVFSPDAGWGRSSNTTSPIPFKRLSHLDLDSIELGQDILIRLFDVLKIFSKSTLKTISFRKVFDWDQKIEGYGYGSTYGQIHGGFCRYVDVALNCWGTILNEHMSGMKWGYLQFLFHDNNELYLADRDLDLFNALWMTGIDIIAE